VHRALRAARHGLLNEETREEWSEDLPEVARHTSEMERRADDAERELLQWKKVKFMADKVGDEFEGYITGVAAFGLFIELIEHFVEGMVHVSTMADDYYRFLEGTHALVGENTHKSYRLGDKVRGPGHPREHGDAPGGSRPRRDPRARPRRRARRTAQQGDAEGREAPEAAPGRRERQGRKGGRR
jgi:ribonuclease R